MKKRLAICLFVFCCSYSYAGSIKKAFEALKVYNYFLAKKLFEKAEKKQIAIASYGLSIIYLRSDNPFHNIDSAYQKITLSVLWYDSLKAKTQSNYYEDYAFDKNALLKQRAEVSSSLYQRSVKVNTELQFVLFLQKNPWANEVKLAEHKRDSLAFQTAFNGDKANDYELFISKYPNSEYSKEAQDLFYQRQYEEAIQSDSLQAYITFISTYPENPHVSDAQDVVFKRETQDDNVTSYADFIKFHSNYKNVDMAWRMLYRSYMRNFSVNRLNEFETEFPGYPFQDELKQERTRINDMLLPYNTNGKWGIINQVGTILVDARFDGIDYFHEGIAVVSLNDKLGYINSTGKYLFFPQFDDATPFQNGLAVVSQNNLYGIISRSGKYIIPLAYKEISTEDGEHFWLLKDSLYAYYSASDNRVYKALYNNVKSFDNGDAAVKKDTAWGLINSQNQLVLGCNFEDVYALGTLYFAKKGGTSFLFSIKGDTLFQEDSVRISPFSEGKALIEKYDKIAIIDTNAKFVTGFQFDNYPNAFVFGLFKNGHAKMYDFNKDKFGLVDSIGNWVIQPRFADISFYSNIIAAKRSNYWEYWSPTMQKKWNRRFANAESFIGASAVVVDESKYGLFGTNGEFLLPATWDEIIEISPSLLRLKDSLGYVLSDKLGNLKLQQHFESIKQVMDNVLQLKKDGQLYHYLINEERLVGKGDAHE